MNINLGKFSNIHAREKKIKIKNPITQKAQIMKNYVI